MQDGYTQKATGPEAVSVLVATEAKPNCDIDEKMLTKKFYKSFLEVSSFRIIYMTNIQK